MIWADRLVVVALILFAVTFGIFGARGDLEAPAALSFLKALTYVAFVFGLPLWLCLRAVDAIMTGKVFRTR